MRQTGCLWMVFPTFTEQDWGEGWGRQPLAPSFWAGPVPESAFVSSLSAMSLSILAIYYALQTFLETSHLFYYFFLNLFTW